MAVFNEILVGRFARSVQKLFGVKAQPPVNALSSDVICTHQYFSASENRYLEGWQLYAHETRNQGGGAAGNTVGYRFRNPAGSNVIAVFTYLLMSTYTASDEIFVSHGPNVLDMITVESPTGDRLDPRGQANPSVVISHAAAGNIPPGVLNPLMNMNLPTAGTFGPFLTTANHEIPLLPGEALQIQNSVINVVFAISVMWRERFLEDSERT